MNKKQLAVGWIIVFLSTALALANDSKLRNNNLDLEKLYWNADSSEVNLKATGYDWVNYSKDEKLELMNIMFDFYKLDRTIYSPEKGVELFDISYYQAEKIAKDNPDLDKNAYFGIPCLLNFGSILNDKETEWGIETMK